MGLEGEAWKWKSRLPVGDGDEACCRASVIEGTPFLLSNEALDWNQSGRRQIRGSTESGYGSIINKQLVPRLGAIAVSALRFDHIDAAVSGMIEDELSSKTIHNTVTLLRTMLAGKRGPSALRRGFRSTIQLWGSSFRHWNPARSRRRHRNRSGH